MIKQMDQVYPNFFTESYSSAARGQHNLKSIENKSAIAKSTPVLNLTDNVDASAVHVYQQEHGLPNIKRQQHQIQQYSIATLLPFIQNVYQPM